MGTEGATGAVGSMGAAGGARAAGTAGGTARHVAYKNQNLIRNKSQVRYV